MVGLGVLGLGVAVLVLGDPELAPQAVWTWYASLGGWVILLATLGWLIRLGPGRGMVSPFGVLMILGALGLHYSGHVAISEEPLLSLTPYSASLAGLTLETQRELCAITQVMHAAGLVLLWVFVWRHAPAIWASVARRRGFALVAWIKALLGFEPWPRRRRARAYHALWLGALYHTVYATSLNALAGLEHLGMLELDMLSIQISAGSTAILLVILSCVLGVVGVRRAWSNSEDAPS